MNLEDNQLVERFLEGDEAALNQLVKKYLKPVYNFLYYFTRNQAELDDLTQIAFIKAWKNLRKFDRKKKFKTWVFAIAKNTAYDFFHKKKTLPFANFIDEEGNNKLENISDGSILPDEILERKDIAKELEKKLKEIPEHYRIILMLHYKEDFSLSEIAEILDKPYNTIKSGHQRGLTKLKKLLLAQSHPK
jgi:RNA polymerase sigma-70 factor (ECF subfamily)